MRDSFPPIFLRRLGRNGSAATAMSRDLFPWQRDTPEDSPASLSYIRKERGEVTLGPDLRRVSPRRSRPVPRPVRSSTRLQTRRLIGGISSSTTTSVATTVAPSRYITTSAATEEASTPSTSSSTPTTARHARDVGPLGRHFDIPSFEHALVEHQGLRHQTGFRKLDICITKMFRIGQHRSCFLHAGASRNARGSEEGGRGAGRDQTYPFGVPVNLSSKIVTRLIEPQL